MAEKFDFEAALKAVQSGQSMTGKDSKKEVLGLYLSESEGANFWLSALTDLQNRGVEKSKGIHGRSEARVPGHIAR